MCLVIKLPAYNAAKSYITWNLCWQCYTANLHNNNSNNNNNSIVICKAHKVSSNTESEAPALVRWAELVGYAKRIVLRRRLKVSAVGDSLVSRGKSFQTVGAPCKVAEVFISHRVRDFTLIRQAHDDEYQRRSFPSISCAIVHIKRSTEQLRD